MDRDVSTACFLHHSLQITKWDKNTTFLSLTSSSNCCSLPEQFPVSDGDVRKLQITNTQLSPNVARIMGKKKKAIQNVSKTKIQTCSSDTYSRKQNELDLATTKAQHLNGSDSFRTGLHETQRQK